jgi:hypothetical protein
MSCQDHRIVWLNPRKELHRAGLIELARHHSGWRLLLFRSSTRLCEDQDVQHSSHGNIRRRQRETLRESSVAPRRQAMRAQGFKISRFLIGSDVGTLVYYVYVGHLTDDQLDELTSEQYDMLCLDPPVSVA